MLPSNSTGPAPPQQTAVEAEPDTHADDRRKLATGLHWASLVAAFGFLFWANRDQWFDSDEWNFLVRRRLVGSSQFLGIWEPHNKHWVTLPVLVYRLLFNVFGVRTYAPYLVLLLVLSLLVAHLLWRILLRFGVDPLLATAAAAVFAFVGAGWENVTNGFQITLIAPLVLGLGAVLVVRDHDLTVRRYGVVWLLLIAAVMSSGVGVTMVAVVAVIALFEHGLKAAVIIGSAPAAAYLIWFGLEGRHAPAAAGEQGLWPALQATPAFLWRGLTGAVDVETGLTGAGAVLVLLLVVWALRHADLADRAWRDATVLALGAVLFISLTAIGRSGLGADNAAASRYSYIVLALLLPLAVVALDQLLGTHVTRWLAMGLGLGFLLLVSVSTVAHNADAAGIREQDQERRVLATAQLTRGRQHVPRDHPGAYLYARSRCAGDPPTSAKTESCPATSPSPKKTCSPRASISNSRSGVPGARRARCPRRRDSGRARPVPRRAGRHRAGMPPGRARLRHANRRAPIRAPGLGDDPHRARGQRRGATRRRCQRRDRPRSWRSPFPATRRSASTCRRAVWSCVSTSPRSVKPRCAGSALDSCLTCPVV